MFLFKRFKFGIGLNLDSLTCKCLLLKYRENSHSLPKSKVPSLSPLSLPSLSSQKDPGSSPGGLLETPSVHSAAGELGTLPIAQGPEAWMAEAAGKPGQRPPGQNTPLPRSLAAKNPCLIPGQKGVDSSHCG